MKGIVTIKKVFSDGTEELVAHDDNVLSINLARSYVNLFSNNVKGSISDLLIGYFQVGFGSLDVPEDPQERKYVYTLEEPFTESDYGTSTTSEIDVHDQIYGDNFKPTDSPQVLKGTFVNLSDDFSTRVSDNTVYYRLNIGEKTANGKNIQEFGLFSRNPNNFKIDRSSMIAYKTLASPVEKTDLFSLVIDWQIKFIDAVEELDQDSQVGSTGQAGEGYNVVLIMADDFGVDQLGIYDAINPYDLSSATNATISPYSVSDVEIPAGGVGGSGIYAYTPALSAMAAGGITFFNARANTMCTPTRANILTGKCAFSSPNFQFLDDNEELLYKGCWGHGLASVTTEVFQKMRGGLKALGGKYLFKNPDTDNIFGSEFGIVAGTPISLEYAVVGGGSQDSVDDRRRWPSSWLGSEATHAIPGYNHPGTSTGKIPANFTILPSLIRDESFVPSAYESGMIGKWHLCEWDDLWIYSEGSQGAWTRAKGNGWRHIRNIGKWDYANAMFHNLNKIPIPGHYNDYSNVANGSPGWFAGIMDKDMGYLNYFQWNYSGLDAWEDTSSLTTVSSTGYTTFIESYDAWKADSPITYEQGYVSDYATNKTFDDAVSMFNGMKEPFFLYLPLNATHTPYTYPHNDTVYSDLYKRKHAQKLYEDLGNIDPTSGTWANQNAQIENMDYCLSSFLEGIDEERKERTIFIFQGDNGTDSGIIQRTHDYASGTFDSVGEAAMGQPGGRGGLGCPSGLGLIYKKMLAAGTEDDDPQLLSLKGHQGGAGNTPAFFKSSVYDRGVLIPYIVSANFLDSLSLAGTSSMAFIDVVDDYATIAHIAGVNYDLLPKTQPYFTDGISFLPILRGQKTAETHVRQHSFFEMFKPIGNSTGLIDGTGTFSGKIGKYKPRRLKQPDHGGEFEYYYRGIEDLPAYTPGWQGTDNPACAPIPQCDYGLSTASYMETTITNPDTGGLGKSYVPFERRRGFIERVDASTLGREAFFGYDPDLPNPWLPDASAGMWKIVRPTEGPSGDEIYQQRNYLYEDVDQYEFVDLLMPYKLGGTQYNASLGNPSNIAGQIHQYADLSDNDDHWWKLLRVYIHMTRGLAYYLQYRRRLPGAVDSMYASLPEAAARVALPTTDDRINVL